MVDSRLGGNIGSSFSTLLWEKNPCSHCREIACNNIQACKNKIENGGENFAKIKEIMTLVGEI
jgi:hypothetical protein